MHELVIEVEVTEEGADDERIDLLTRHVLRELRDSTDARVERVRTAPPVGSKSGSATSLATLVVTIAGSSAVTATVQALAGWARHGRRREVRLTCGGESLDLSSATPRQQDELVAAWLERRRADRPQPDQDSA